MALTDAAGAVTDAYAYDPFGQPLGHTGTSDQPFTFNGRLGILSPGDGPAGLYSMRQRWYDAATGRFLSPDPAPPQALDPATLNPYQFADNAPLGRVDATGRRSGPADAPQPDADWDRPGGPPPMTWEDTKQDLKRLEWEGRVLMG